MNNMERIALVATGLATIQAHLTTHTTVVAPASVTIHRDGYPTTAALHLHIGPTLTRVAAGLVAWADTLTEVTGDLWRTPAGERVHIHLTGLTGGVTVTVWDAVTFHPDMFGDLAPRAHQPVALEQLRAWARAEVPA